MKLSWAFMYDFVPRKHPGVEWLSTQELYARLLETLRIVFQGSCTILPSPSACPPPGESCGYFTASLTPAMADLFTCSQPSMVYLCYLINDVASVLSCAHLPLIFLLWFKSFIHFVVGCFTFFIIEFEYSLYSLDTSSWLANNFSLASMFILLIILQTAAMFYVN